MRLFPKSEDFFQYFEAAAQHTTASAALLSQIVANLDRAAEIARQIKDHEHEADEILHETMNKLNATFITPFDREDIHTLISRLDDVMDCIDMAASRIVLYEIRRLPAELATLTSLLDKATASVTSALARFKNLKRSEETMKEVIEVNRIENEADTALRAALANLFKSEKDPIELIKLKEVCEVVENAIDRCEDVVNVIEGVLVKNA